MERTAGALMAAILFLTAGCVTEDPTSTTISLMPSSPLLAVSLAGTGHASAELVQTPEYDPVYRVRVSKAFRDAWTVQAMIPVIGDIDRGDTVQFSAALRSAGPSGRVHLRLQKNSSPWPAIIDRTIGLDQDWTVVELPVRSAMSLPDGTAVVTFHLAFAEQTVEIADVSLTNHGPDMDPLDLPGGRVTYEGREPDAPWRQAAAARIDERRKAPLRVSVVDAFDRAVTGARITVTQKTHAFGFGSAIGPRELLAGGPDGDRYREVVARYFNKAPLENGLRWQNWHPMLPGQVRKREIDDSLDWLVEQGIEARGHYLLWGPIHDKSKPVPITNKDRLKEEHDRHMAAKIAYVGDRVGEWDAINHIVGWGEIWSDLFGEEDYLRVIRRARDLVPPGTELWINEGQILPGGSRREAYRQIAGYVAEAEVGLDGIGFMGHFREGSLTPISEIYDVLQDYAPLGLPLQLTEFDVDTQDAELQADYLRDVMTVCFSHPSVEAVVMWGFWEGRHWRPDAALWNRDWSIKPAGQVWLDLVWDQWLTLEEHVTDDLGAVVTRGFLGDYEIRAEKGGLTGTTTVSHNRRGTEVRIVLR